MICPQCGWTGDIGSEAHRTFIHPAAAPVTDAGLREDYDRLVAAARAVAFLVPEEDMRRYRREQQALRALIENTDH